MVIPRMMPIDEDEEEGGIGGVYGSTLPPIS
jgi:hypothetical protein